MSNIVLETWFFAMLVFARPERPAPRLEGEVPRKTASVLRPSLSTFQQLTSISCMLLMALSVVSVAEEAPRVNQDSEVADFAVRRDGGVSLYLRETSRQEKGELRVLNSEGQIAISHQYDNAAMRISPKGEFAFAKKRLANSCEIEVLDLSQNSKRQYHCPTNAAYAISDAGTLFQFPGEGGGEFALLDARGERLVLEPSRPGPPMFSISWSPNGEALLLVDWKSSTAQCIQKSNAVFRFDFSERFPGALPRVLATWDDCTSLISLQAALRQAPQTLLLISPKGQILREMPIGNGVRGQTAAISPDLTLFAFVEDKHIIHVLRRDSFTPIETIEFPKESIISRIHFGKTNKDLAIVGLNRPPPAKRFDDLEQESPAHWIRFVRGRTLLPREIATTRTESDSIQGDARGRLHYLKAGKLQTEEITP